MSSHVFVDESKDRAYLLVASIHVSGELEDLRKLMRGLVLRGQRRVHMKKESDPRRRAIAAAICGAGVSATVYDAGQRYRYELDARAACLRGVVKDAAGRGETMLVIEQDDSLVDWDRRRLYALAREARLPLLRYEHRRASAEQLLAVPDVIAWCWAKGGHWRHRIGPAVSTVRQV
ncbi:MAG: hypothetical protein ACR2QA_18020 [Solirubrobacteraceae bacterium]